MHGEHRGRCRRCSSGRFDFREKLPVFGDRGHIGVMSELSQIHRVRRDVRFRVVDNEAVVLQQTAAEVLVLNEVGKSILKLVDGRRTGREIALLISREYRVDPLDAENDVRTFIDQLRGAGVVEEGEVQTKI